MKECFFGGHFSEGECTAASTLFLFSFQKNSRPRAPKVGAERATILPPRGRGPWMTGERSEIQSEIPVNNISFKKFLLLKAEPFEGVLGNPKRVFLLFIFNFARHLGRAFFPPRRGGKTRQCKVIQLKVTGCSFSNLIILGGHLASRLAGTCPATGGAATSCLLRGLHTTRSSVNNKLTLS